jgi:hypothetical protein
MSRFLLAAIVTMLIVASTPMQAANSEQLPADIVTGLLPLATYAITRYKGDDLGEGEFLRSNVASLVVTSALRVSFNQTGWGKRPNGKGYGFPSGHVAFVTSSAAFLEDRYGWRYGVPAYLLAGYVAYVRVNTGFHRWRDVAASGALSYGISKLFVTPLHATYLAPMVGPRFFGLRWERSF